MKWIIRVTKMVVAPAVLAVSLVAACGGDDGARTQVRSQAEAPSAQSERQQQFRAAATAERLERQAKLDGHLATYDDDETEAPAEEQEFLPGSRHVPTR